MYCSSCGKTVAAGLSFCNHCGYKLNGKGDEHGERGVMPESSYNFLIAALLGLPIAGIGLIIGVMSVMKKELGIANDAIAVVVMFCFFLLLTAEIGFMRLLLSRTAKPKAKKVSKDERRSEAATRALNEAQPFDQVNPVGSVTENTTRNFEPAYREPRGQ
jgi:hypothetical protein